jgi:hypothetical protein
MEPVRCSRGWIFDGPKLAFADHAHDRDAGNQDSGAAKGLQPVAALCDRNPLRPSWTSGIHFIQMSCPRADQFDSRIGRPIEGVGIRKLEGSDLTPDGLRADAQIHTACARRLSEGARRRAAHGAGGMLAPIEK